MPGIPGRGGPVPKRSDQRRRRNKDVVGVTEALGAETVDIPEPDPHWHHAAIRWYESLAESGQSQFYEPSDWATAWIWAEMIDRALHQGAKPSSQLIMAWSAGANSLLTTEGERRRLRLELSRADQGDPDEDSAVTALDEFRSRFSS